MPVRKYTARASQVFPNFPSGRPTAEMCRTVRGVFRGNKTHTHTRARVHVCTKRGIARSGIIVIRFSIKPVLRRKESAHERKQEGAHITRASSPRSRAKR